MGEKSRMSIMCAADLDGTSWSSYACRKSDPNLFVLQTTKVRHCENASRAASQCARINKRVTAPEWSLLMTKDQYHRDRIGNRKLRPETLMLGYGYDPQ